MLAIQELSEPASHGVQSGVVEWRRAGDSADSVGTEKFFSHDLNGASVTPRQSNIASWRSRACGSAVVHFGLPLVQSRLFINPA